MPRNLYFVIAADAQNEAEAIAEAFEIAKSSGMAMVSVRECGTQRVIANVHDNGSIGFPSAAQLAAANN